MPTYRPYQKEDLAFLIRKDRAAIFNEQRTGKTPTAIGWAHLKRLRKVLIVCPASAQYAWASEFTTWTAGRPATIIRGTPAQRAELIANWDKGAAIISYDMLKETANRKGEIDTLLKHNIDAVIADEAHRFKSRTSMTYQAMKRLTKIPCRIALTGTPAPGKPWEIFAILQWLQPKQFTTYWGFIDTYFMRRMAYGKQGQRFQEITGFKPGAELELQRYLDTMSTNRKRKDVMQWLPDKDIQYIKIPCTDRQRAMLDELEQYYSVGDLKVVGVLDQLMRTRQICVSPTLISETGGPSPKTEWIKEYLTDYPGTPTVIFSKFRTYIAQLQQALPPWSYGTIAGDVSAERRAEVVDMFQNGKINLLLVQIDAGKEALTLSRGECVIFTDAYPPVATMQQAEDRITSTDPNSITAHRIIHLVMQGTYEEQIHKLLDKNASETSLINDYKSYLQKGEHNGKRNTQLPTVDPCSS